MIKILSMCSVFLLVSFAAEAKTIEIDCPKVEVNNPYTIVTPPSDGWQPITVAKSYLNCRHYIDPQGFLRCSYKASAHSSVNTYGLKKSPPENVTCEKKEVVCGFVCTENINKLIPKIKAPIKKLDLN